MHAVVLYLGCGVSLLAVVADVEFDRVNVWFLINDVYILILFYASLKYIPVLKHGGSGLN